MLTSVIATDYNRVVCIKTDEEWWGGYRLMEVMSNKSSLLKKKKERNYRVHLQRGNKKQEREKGCCRMRALWQLLGCPPSPLFSSLPPCPLLVGRKKKKHDGREGERGRRNDSGLDGWWWMKQWRCSSGAAVWCWEIWRRAVAVCRTSQSPPMTCLLCLVWLIYSDPWDKNINILMPNKMCVFTYMTWM